jgi:hypothetical protein
MKKSHNQAKVKYDAIATSDKCENEILLNDCDDNSKHVKLNFDSIHKFHSIHKYTKPSDLYRLDAHSIYSGRSSSQVGFFSCRFDCYIVFQETKPLSGLDKFTYYGILSLSYGLMVAFMPFSLFVCLKKVRNNERIVLYRLGRTIKPALEPGYHVLFPVVDSYQRVVISQKEFSLPNLQVCPLRYTFR